jgi:hypothetical protein
MSVVDILKSVGAVTLPKRVIEGVERGHEMVEGRLHLTKLRDNSVLISFVPNNGSGTLHPLLAKSTGQAESHLINTFGLSPGEAKTQAANLEQAGEAEMPISIQRSLASELVLYR